MGTRTWRWKARRAIGDTRGSSVTEFALVLPLFCFIVMVSIQFVLIFMQFYGMKLATDNTLRWLAISPDVVDSGAIAQLDSLVPPGVDPSSFTSIVITPSCPTLTNGHCSNRNPGDVLSIQVTYDLSKAFVLPTTWGVGDMQVTFPTQLPAYQVSTTVE